MYLRQFKFQILAYIFNLLADGFFFWFARAPTVRVRMTLFLYLYLYLSLRLCSTNKYSQFKSNTSVAFISIASYMFIHFTLTQFHFLISFFFLPSSLKSFISVFFFQKLAASATTGGSTSSVTELGCNVSGVN